MTEEEQVSRIKAIDIRAVFRDKNPRMARIIPGFVFRYIHRILHLDFINNLMLSNEEKRDFPFSQATVDAFGVSVDVIGEQNLPPDGRYIFASNHPLGGFDGLLLYHELSKHYPEVKVLVNDILMNIRNMENSFVPINKHGSQPMDNVRRIDELFMSDAQILTFPAGLVSRRKKGVIRDDAWQKSFITKAKSTDRAIVPIHITGRNSNFFYNLANTRTFLGVKYNLEMFFLMNETYKNRGKHFTVTVGKPIPNSVFDKRFTPKDWALKVQDHVYHLASDPEARFEF
ncbi:MAG: 1-acyl-sn-glycerol-3-phosphate acyltransferase [Bacteroidota bacterium]